jgi:hypothetical protein
MSQIREEAMEDFISRYERQLVAARPRRLWLRKPLALGAIGIALVAGTATAAMAPWTPDLGAGHPREFDISRSAAPEAQMAALAVLRRPQTDVDRGPQATYALRFFSKQTGSVRADAVRVLQADHDQGAAVLVPVTTAESDSLCVFVRDATDGGAQGCHPVDELRAGEIRGAMSDRGGLLIWGLVPDDVTTIRLKGVGSQDGLRLPVRDNFYQAHLDAGPDGVRFDAIEWLDGAGDVLKTQEGMAIAPPSSTKMSVDCGERGIVPLKAGQEPDEACDKARAK